MAQTHVEVDTALKAEQERLRSRRQELEAEIKEIEQRVRRIDAYFDTAPGPLQGTRAPQRDRHPRGFVQSTVLKTITAHPQGMTSAEIMKELGPQGIGQQSIANALSALSQAKKITSQGRGGKYLPATAEVPTTSDQTNS